MCLPLVRCGIEGSTFCVSTSVRQFLYPTAVNIRKLRDKLLWCLYFAGWRGHYSSYIGSCEDTAAITLAVARTLQPLHWQLRGHCSPYIGSDEGTAALTFGVARALQPLHLQWRGHCSPYICSGEGTAALTFGVARALPW